MDIHRLKRALLRLLLLLLLYFLQTDVFSHLRIAGVCPLLLPLAAVGFGLFEGGLTGGLWGLLAGLLCDLSLGEGTVAFTVFLTLAGFFTGFLAEFLLSRGFPSFLLLSLAVLLLAVLLQLFPLLAAPGAPLAALGRAALIQTLYSLVFVLPVYWAVRGVSRIRAR